LNIFIYKLFLLGINPLSASNVNSRHDDTSDGPKRLVQRKSSKMAPAVFLKE